MNDSLLEYKLDLVAAHLGVYKIEEVAAVIHRQHTNPDDGRIVDVVDFYPAWNAYGTYGKMKVCHEYLDEDWQRERFEKYAGVSLESLPLYDGQTALQRRFGQPHRCETAVQPFRLMVQPRKDENGNYDKTLILRYLPSPKARQGQPAQPQPTAVTQPATPTRTAPAANGQAQAPNGHVQQPPAPGRQPVAPPVTPAEWLNRARQATDPFDFDICLQRGLIVGGAVYFETADHAEKARTGLFGDWNGSPAAYLAGIERYVKTRADLLSAGEPGAAVFQKAKSAALVAYREALERGVA